MTSPLNCFWCYLKQFPIEKARDHNFFWERKNEFFPEEEFGEYCKVCEDCHHELYCLNKILDTLD